MWALTSQLVCGDFLPSGCTQPYPRPDNLAHNTWSARLETSTISKGKLGGGPGGNYCHGWIYKWKAQCQITDSKIKEIFNGCLKGEPQALKSHIWSARQDIHKSRFMAKIVTESQAVHISLQVFMAGIASVPCRPPPHLLQYGKVGESWYINFIHCMSNVAIERMVERV